MIKLLPKTFLGQINKLTQTKEQKKTEKVKGDVKEREKKKTIWTKHQKNKFLLFEQKEFLFVYLFALTHYVSLFGLVYRHRFLPN